MSAKPPSLANEVDSGRTDVTADDAVTPRPQNQPGAHAATVGQAESEEQRTSDPAEPRSEESATRSGSRKLISKDIAPHLFASGERLPIDVSEKESFGKKLSHWGPTITSIASIVLTMFVWVNARKLSEQQITLQKKQTELQDEQVKAEVADMRTKFFNDLTSTDENKKTLAEIGLAGYGVKAMPVVHLALGVEQGEIRRSAVNVVYRLFQAEMTMDGRKQLMDQLIREFDSPNKTLHTGVVQSLVKIEALMNSNERQQASIFLREKLPPQSTCSEQEGREMVQEAAKFFSAKDTNSVSYLLAIARYPKCGDGWLQAMLKLQESAREMPLPPRSDLLEKIKQLKSDVLKDLREQISDEDLAEGTGFARFGQKGQGSISFMEFRQRVEEEFNVLVP
jgi:hypothetical protein